MGTSHHAAWAVLAVLAAHAAVAAPLTNVRVAFLTDCQMYSDWQSVAMIYSWKMSGQPGKLTRVMCCAEADRKNYPTELLDEVETWIAPSFTIHPVTQDNYAAYNKPEAVIDWLANNTPEEEYVLVLDSDMILRRPFLVEEMHPSPGWAIGARYTYMIGVNNELAMRHVPEIEPRHDTLAGPDGRRGDQVRACMCVCVFSVTPCEASSPFPNPSLPQVGGFFFYYRDDLKRMSTLWLKFTEDVRADDMVGLLAGSLGWFGRVECG
jgi:hypothetical protein